MATDSIYKQAINKQNSHLNLPEMIKKMREGILIVGENLRIIDANDAAIRIFSRGNNSIFDKRLSEVLRNIRVHEAFQNALTFGKSAQIEFETHIRNERSFDVSVTPLSFAEADYAIGVFYDKTKIEHLEKVRQEFLSNISHELRTPLTSILAFVETLENGGVDDKENNLRFLKIIRKNAARMQHLIDDISELSSIEAGKIELELKNIGLFDFVNEIFANLSKAANKRGISLENNVPSDFEVTADLFRFEQMLTNLIDNAIKFNRESGTVVVSAREDEGHYIIDVTDTGEGIPPEQTNRVFERLYRADRARTREVGGTGLGLAIVKHLTRLHNGEVKLASVIGKGSTFTIEFPFKNQELG